MPRRFECAVANALLVVVQEPFKTHLVEKLLLLVDRHKLVLGDDIGRCLRWVLLNHPTAWNLFVPHLLGDDTMLKPTLLPQALWALRELISQRHRVGVRLLLTTLRAGGSYCSENIRSDKAILPLYIEKMCKSPTDFSAKAYGHDNTLEFSQMAQRGFKQLLECAAYTEEQLEAALHFAGKKCSSIAVEVLVSPPYNVPMHEDDLFTHTILTALLAPGEKAAYAAGEEFEDNAKRQCV